MTNRWTNIFGIWISCIKKSDSNSVTFSNIRCSNVKKKDIVYVKVYFNSFFRNASTVSDKPYTITNRIAEIKG